MSVHHARFIIGIDLGTTNCAAYYLDTEADNPQIKHLRIPQLTAPGEVGDGDLLPSFAYVPADSEFAEDALTLPWQKDGAHLLGVLARDHGAASPGRLISSSKSWLAHAGVDRTEPILPWGGTVEHARTSPVAVAEMLLRHVAAAWDRRFGHIKDADGSPCVFADQQVVVTVPASFDETARDLTLGASRAAGCKDLTLLEEPLAAFYSWLNRHDDDWREIVGPGDTVLIVDVGGGTTDFSIVELDDEGALHRFAVGDHLLLGGDNIDMALARKLEAEWGTKLDASSWSQAVQRCRAAKEILLGDKAPEQTTVTIASRGSSLIAGSRSANVTQQQLAELLEDGFYPIVDAQEPPAKRVTGMRTMGLPYAPEPAVTRHLLDFLKLAWKVTEASGRTPVGNTDQVVLRPTRILFNGGSVVPESVRNRICETVAGWFPGQAAPTSLDGEDFSRAVAIGAAYYGRVRRGSGVRVRGGVSRSFFIEAAAEGEDARLVCLMARDTLENVPVRVAAGFQAETNKRVRFTLYSSATRLTDRPGDVIPHGDDVTEVAPLVTVLQFGKDENRRIAAEVETVLSETGVLEVSICSTATDHKWPLRFDLRSEEAAGETAVTVEAARLDEAERAIRSAFNERTEDLKKLPATLEEILGLSKEQWPVPALRHLADVLLDLESARKKSPQHEIRWLNLTGYCLRPGFGDGGDELRLRKVWKWWFAGVANPRQPQAAGEWWVLWRRIAPGLRSGHHVSVSDTIIRTLIPKAGYKLQLKEGPQARMEMLRCLAALELLPIKKKKMIARALLERGSKLESHECWALARLGARKFFHGPANLVVPPTVVSGWLKTLMDGAGKNPPKIRLFAIARIAAACGDRALDLPAEQLDAVVAFLGANGYPDPEKLRTPQLDSKEDQARILGDSIPAGLVLSSD